MKKKRGTRPKPQRQVQLTLTCCSGIKLAKNTDPPPAAPDPKPNPAPPAPGPGPHPAAIAPAMAIATLAAFLCCASLARATPPPEPGAYCAPQERARTFDALRQRRELRIAIAIERRRHRRDRPPRLFTGRHRRSSNHRAPPGGAPGLEQPTEPGPRTFFLELRTERRADRRGRREHRRDTLRRARRPPPPPADQTEPPDEVAPLAPGFQPSRR